MQARAIQQVQAQLVAVLASPSIESAQLTAGNLQYAMSLVGAHSMLPHSSCTH